jgi:hypothetical protein
VVRLLLLALTLAGTAIAGTTTPVSETTSTTYVYALPPAQQRCKDLIEAGLIPNTFRCEMKACLRACGTSAPCRGLCAHGRRRCLLVNGCEAMPFPFCAGQSFPPCDPSSARPQDACALLRLVNRTRDVIATTAIAGVSLGISLPPGGTADAHVPPSLSGATVSAVIAGEGHCERRVVLHGCLEVGVRRRVVFRERATSCSP